MDHSSSSNLVVLNKTLDARNTNWQYFFKNLSQVPFLNDAWMDVTEPEIQWQILLLFEVSIGGSISIDNLGLL